MTDEEIRAMFARHWEHTGVDEEIAHEMYDDDAVLEFPQSGERFVGKVNFQVWRSRYPAKLEMSVRRIRGGGDFWVAENVITYDGSDTWKTVSILELRGGKVVRETIYLTQPFEAPAWREPWRDPEPVD